MQTLERFTGKARRLALLGLATWLMAAPAARAQVRPYIGFVYPAGGQQGTTFQIKLGGQGLDDVNQVFVTGSGVSAKIVEFNRALNPQEITLLNEQSKELKRGKTEAASTSAASATPRTVASPPVKDEATAKLISRIEKRVAEYVNRPACVALATIAYVEVAIASDAPPGARELRLGTPRGVSNPLVFHVGQLPEVCRKPMITAAFEVLGKEELALRKRPDDEVEQRITVPCTVNGQVAPGELNWYRFAARKGQRLVITTQARQLIPYIADAVPGWFQPVLALYDAKGKEVAFNDDFRFKPDPTILFEVPKDGDYRLAIYDSIYRGREDFVYRVSIGELPFVTSLFPMGGRMGEPVAFSVQGWNLPVRKLVWPGTNAAPGVHSLTATNGEFVSNPIPFALDTLPEGVDKEPNNTEARPQKVELPIIINGRVDRPGDWDVFQFQGKSNGIVVAEVSARRLDSPLDSVIKLTDATGKLLALNDDCEDLRDGLNTHHADSCFMVRLPADGTYYVHLGDTARHGGEEYGYRLRLSAPQPDFALRVAPSSVTLRSKNSNALAVYAVRKDGFAGPIKLTFKELPPGFTSWPVVLSPTQTVARLTLKTDLKETPEPVSLSVVGTAKIQGRDVTREAVPAEDRMQAFLWRHLVPATDLKAVVFDPNYQPPPKRVAHARPPTEVQPKPVVASANSAATTPKFTKQQVVGRLRQLKLLFEEGLLTDDFYNDKVAECEGGQ